MQTGFPGFSQQPIFLAPPAQTFRGKAKGNLNKELVVVSKGTISTQVSTTLITATFPCTIVGLRWNFSAAQDAGTAAVNLFWAIVVVREGNTANALSKTDAATMYSPEENVMTFGVGQFEPGAGTEKVYNTIKWDDSTKSMRKLQGGDSLQFIVVAAATNTVSLAGCVQFFCKT